MCRRSERYPAFAEEAGCGLIRALTTGRIGEDKSEKDSVGESILSRRQNNTGVANNHARSAFGGNMVYSNDNGPKSFGGAIAAGVPVLFQANNRIPELIMQAGKEAEALKLLESLGLITITYTKKHKEVETCPKKKR